MKKTKIILMALLSTLLFTACSSPNIVEPETKVSSSGTVDNSDSQNPEPEDIYENPEIGDINDGDENEKPDETPDEREPENNINIKDIFNNTYWVTRTGAIEDDMAMSIHPNLIYGYSLAMGDLSGGDIESIDIQGNTAYVTTFLMDGNGSVTIDYVITQTQPGVITVTEKWNKTPEYGYTETYYQISEEEFNNL